MGDIVSKILFQPPQPPNPLHRYSTSGTSGPTGAPTVRYAWIKTSLGSKISTVHITHRNAKYTLLYSHGNAEDLGFIHNFLLELSSLLHVNILAYDYTGYGFSNNQKGCRFSDDHHFATPSAKTKATMAGDAIDPTMGPNGNAHDATEDSFVHTLANAYSSESSSSEESKIIDDVDFDVGYRAGCSSCTSLSSRVKSTECSEENCHADITAAYLYLTNVLSVPSWTIILYGRSLGSGPTTYLASKLHKYNNKYRQYVLMKQEPSKRHRVAPHLPAPLGGMILHSAFTSAIRTLFDVGSFTLSQDKFSNIDVIHSIPTSCPCFLIHGKKDEVVPFEHAKTLHSRLPKECTKYPPFWAEDAGHDNIESRFSKLYGRLTMEFLQHIRRAHDEEDAMQQKRYIHRGPSRSIPVYDRYDCEMKTTLDSEDKYYQNIHDDSDASIYDAVWSMKSTGKEGNMRRHLDNAHSYSSINSDFARPLPYFQPLAKSSDEDDTAEEEQSDDDVSVDIILRHRAASAKLQGDPLMEALEVLNSELILRHYECMMEKSSIYQ